MLLPIADAARAAFASRDVDDAAAVVISHGGPLPASGAPGPVAVFGPDGGFLALVEDRGEVTRAARGLRLSAHSMRFSIVSSSTTSKPALR